MARASEIIEYIKRKSEKSQENDPEITIRELELNLEWPDLIALFLHKSDPDCYCE